MKLFRLFLLLSLLVAAPAARAEYSGPPIGGGSLVNNGTVQTEDYTVQNSDKGKIIPLGGNALFTVTVDDPTAYPTTMYFALENVDRYKGPLTGRGKHIHINSGGQVSDFILWPWDGQIVKFNRVGSNWFMDRPARSKTPSQATITGPTLPVTSIAYGNSSIQGYLQDNGILVVTTLTSGNLRLGQAVFGTAATVPPVILKQLDGTTNGVGQYLTDGLTAAIGTPLSPVALTTRGALATIADTAWLQTGDPLKIESSSPVGFNFPPSPNSSNLPNEMVMISPTQFGYPMAANPGGTSTTSTVHNTQSYLEVRVDPTNGKEDFTTDCLGLGAEACGSMNFAVTAMVVPQFDSFFKPIDGGATYVRVTGAANQTDTASLHDSSQGTLSAGGHAIVVSGNPGFIIAGDTTNNTVEGNLDASLYLTNLTISSQPGTSCIGPHQGGGIFINDLVTLKDCYVNGIVMDESWIFLGRPLLIDTSTRTPTNLINNQAGGSVENHTFNSAFIFLNNATFNGGVGDIVFASGGTNTILPNMTVDIGGTRYTPTAVTWAGTGSCGAATGLTNFACATLAAHNITDLNTGQVMGVQMGDAYHPGANGVVTLHVADSTHVWWTVATNPGQSVATDTGVIVDSPRAQVVSHQFELYAASALSLNGTYLPGNGQAHDSGGVVKGDNLNNDILTWTKPQTFTGATNVTAGMGGSPIIIGSNTYGSTAGQALTVPLNATSGTPRMFKFQNAGVDVWKQGLVGGTDWQIDRLNGSGVFQDTPLKIASATGALTIGSAGMILGGSTAHGIPLTEGASVLANTGAGGLGQLLVGQGTTADPAWVTASGSCTIDVAGVISCPGMPAASATANTVFAGPTSGGAAAPAFRSLVPADEPLTTNTAQPDWSTLTGAMALPNGTTAQRPSSPAAGTERYNTTMACREAYRAATTTWRCYGGVYVACQGIGSVTNTAETNIAACKIPANMMGPNGKVQIDALWTFTSSANAKVPVIRVSATSGSTSSGDTPYASNSFTTNTMFNDIRFIRAQNSTSLQAGFAAGATTPFGTSTSAAASSTIDTTADWYVNINGKAAGGETLSVSYTATVINPRRRRRRAANDNRRPPHWRRAA